MELLIRSQNRKVLAKIHSISIEEKTSTKFAMVGNDEWRLGIYDTEERALEVLDEIQEYIENYGETFAESNNGIVSNFKYYGRVYEIPKE